MKLNNAGIFILMFEILINLIEHFYKNKIVCISHIQRPSSCQVA